jgi:hypothetical protein
MVHEAWCYPGRGEEELMKARVILNPVAVAGSLFLARAALAADIDSASWKPGTGSVVALVDGGSAQTIDTVVSKGVITVVATYPSPQSAVTVVYGVETMVASRSLWK